MRDFYRTGFVTPTWETWWKLLDIKVHSLLLWTFLLAPGLLQVRGFSAIVPLRIFPHVLTEDLGDFLSPRNLQLAIPLSLELRQYLGRVDARAFSIYLVAESEKEKGLLVPQPAEGILLWEHAGIAFLDIRSPAPSLRPGLYHVRVHAYGPQGNVAIGDGDRPVRLSSERIHMVFLIDRSIRFLPHDSVRKYLEAMEKFLRLATCDTRIASISVFAFHDEVEVVEVWSRFTPSGGVSNRGERGSANGSLSRERRSHHENFSPFRNGFEGRLLDGIFTEESEILDRCASPSWKKGLSLDQAFSAVEEYLSRSDPFHRAVLLLFTEGRKHPPLSWESHRRLAEKKIPIYSITFSSPESPLLKRIARETGGRNYRVETEEDLASLYLEIVPSLRQNPLLFSLPIPADRQARNILLPIDSEIQAFQLFWESGDPIAWHLFAPSKDEERVHDTLSPQKGEGEIHVLGRRDPPLFHVLNPSPGRWSLFLPATTLNRSRMLYAAAETDLFLDVFPPQWDGSTLTLAATLARGKGLPIRGRIRLLPIPALHLPAIDLADDGLHDDGEGGDGVFAVCIPLSQRPPTDVPFRFQASGVLEDGIPFVREVETRFTPLPLPSFPRRTSPSLLFAGDVRSSPSPDPKIPPLISVPTESIALRTVSSMATNRFPTNGTIVPSAEEGDPDEEDPSEEDDEEEEHEHAIICREDSHTIREPHTALGRESLRPLSKVERVSETKRSHEEGFCAQSAGGREWQPKRLWREIPPPRNEIYLPRSLPEGLILSKSPPSETQPTHSGEGLPPVPTSLDRREVAIETTPTTPKSSSGGNTPSFSSRKQVQEQRSRKEGSMTNSESWDPCVSRSLSIPRDPEESQSLASTSLKASLCSTLPPLTRIPSSSSEDLKKDSRPPPLPSLPLSRPPWLSCSSIQQTERSYSSPRNLPQPLDVSFASECAKKTAFFPDPASLSLFSSPFLSREQEEKDISRSSPISLLRIGLPLSYQPALIRHEGAKVSMRPTFAVDLGGVQRVVGILRANASSTTLPKSLFVAWLHRQVSGLPLEVREVELTPSTLSLCQILFWQGEGEHPLAESEIEALRRYLLGGGSLWIDDCSALHDGVFPAWIAWQIRGDGISPLQPLPPDHPITCAWREGMTGESDLLTHPQGLQVGERWAVVITRGGAKGTSSLFSRLGEVILSYLDIEGKREQRSETSPSVESMLSSEATPQILTTRLPRSSAGNDLNVCLWEDFDRDPERIRSWEGARWGDPVVLSLVPDGAGGMALRLHCCSGERGCVALGYTAQKNEGYRLDLSNYSALILDMYNGGSQPMGIACFIQTQGIDGVWRDFASEPVILLPGWNRRVRFSLLGKRFRARATGWRNYDSAVTGLARTGKIGFLISTEGISETDLLLDNLRWEQPPPFCLSDATSPR